MFSLTFPVLCKFTFPIFWELYGFLLLPKYLRNPLLWNVCVFPYFSLTMEIHFFHILGIVWISASLKIVEKPTNLKCLYFFMLFMYNGNPLFPYFGNCMNFCIKRNISETLSFEMFVFSHISSPKIFEKLWNVCFFPYFSRIMGIHFSHVLGTAWISASSKKFQKPLTLKCSCFPIFFRYCANSLFSCSGRSMD